MSDAPKTPAKPASGKTTRKDPRVPAIGFKPAERKRVKTAPSTEPSKED